MTLGILGRALETRCADGRAVASQLFVAEARVWLLSARDGESLDCRGVSLPAERTAEHVSGLTLSLTDEETLLSHCRVGELLSGALSWAWKTVLSFGLSLVVSLCSDWSCVAGTAVTWRSRRH